MLRISLVGGREVLFRKLAQENTTIEFIIEI